jgi:peptidoglycan/LPS O-acetylase OafA/YrhL
MKESGYIGKILLTKPFRKIGLWSYSIYMLHALILTGVSRIFEFILEWDIDSSLGYKSLLVNTALILVIVFLSKFSFNYIEVVFRNKSRQISKKYDKSMQPNKPLASQDSTIINRNS